MMAASIRQMTSIRWGITQSSHASTAGSNWSIALVPRSFTVVGMETGTIIGGAQDNGTLRFTTRRWQRAMDTHVRWGWRLLRIGPA